MLRSLGFLKSFAVAVLLLLFSINISYGKQDVPQLKQPVMDLANMLSTNARNSLNQQLLEYDRTKGSQIVVLTISTLGNDDLFSYGTRVFDQWQLGRQGIDDGILLIIVEDAKRIQIFVGSGLEGAIPDAYAKRIISEIMTPQFRQGNIDGGVIQAVAQIEKLIAGEELADPDPQHNNEEDLSSIIGLYFFFCIFGLPYYLKKICGKVLGTIIFVAPSFSLPFLFGISWPISIVIAIAVFFASFLSPMGGPGGGGGFGGGRGGSRRSSGGGFSGGGGGFRGGGASGGW